MKTIAESIDFYRPIRSELPSDEIFQTETGLYLHFKGQEVKIGAGRVAYRFGSSNKISKNGAELLDIPTEDYAPLHLLFQGLDRAIGQRGLARAPIFVPGENGTFKWKEGPPMSLDSALDFYRFGEFLYESPIPAWSVDANNRNGHNKQIVTFTPNGDPNIPFGRVELTYTGVKSGGDLPSRGTVIMLERLLRNASLKLKS